MDINQEILNRIAEALERISPNIDKKIIGNIVKYIQGDLRKIESLYTMYKNNNSLLSVDIVENIFQQKNYRNC